MIEIEYKVPGFKAGGIHSGIKKGNKKDLALIYSERPASVAGLFTTNKVKAAPVLLDLLRIKDGTCQALVINSGNANACTGERGYEDSKEMSRLTAEALEIDEELVLVASTGVIGVPLPMKRIEKGIPLLIEHLSPYGWEDVAEAIMTTDTFPKLFCGRESIEGREITLLGVAKGAGMIMPQMATMLAFFVTDACIEEGAMREAFASSVDKTFNMITVDGDMSTNDTALILANGAAGNPLIRRESRYFLSFQSLLERGCRELSRKIVLDGEGATKLLEIEVVGALDDEDARKVAYRVANSVLVKTAFFGKDPNWGRIMAALGSSMARVEERRVDILFDDLCVVRDGVGYIDDKDERIRDVLKRRDIKITIDLNIGKGRVNILTTDLSPEYVIINSSYRS